MAIVLLAVTAVAGVLARPQPSESQPSGGGAPNGEVPVRAYLVATGIFAVPAEGQGPGTYAAALALARAAHAPLAKIVFVDQPTFDGEGWRDLVQVGRVPINRPPAVDFRREVAVLAWPVAGQAPAALFQAPGLSVRGATLQQHGVALELAPTVGAPPAATPAAGHTFAPYALVTIPRNQWPIPVSAPDVPPLVATLAQ